MNPALGGQDVKRRQLEILHVLHRPAVVAVGRDEPLRMIVRSLVPADQVPDVDSGFAGTPQGRHRGPRPDEGGPAARTSA